MSSIFFLVNIDLSSIKQEISKPSLLVDDEKRMQQTISQSEPFS